MSGLQGFGCKGLKVWFANISNKSNLEVGRRKTDIWSDHWVNGVVKPDLDPDTEIDKIYLCNHRGEIQRKVQILET